MQIFSNTQELTQKLERLEAKFGRSEYFNERRVSLLTTLVRRMSADELDAVFKFITDNTKEG